VWCPSCRAENAEVSKFCSNCGMSLAPAERAPDLPPPLPPAVSPAPLLNLGPLTVETPRSVARLGDRLLAAILDTLVVVGLYAVIGMYAGRYWGGLTEQGFSLEGTKALAVISGALLVAFLYYWAWEGVFGATPGKAMVGIQVRAWNGRRCTLKASAIRNLARLIDGFGVYLVGFLVAAFSKDRRRIGDYLAKTVVVERHVALPLRLGVVLVWFTALGGSVWWAYQIHSGTPGLVTSLPAAEPATVVPVVGAALSEAQPVAGASIPVVARSGNLAVASFRLLEKQGGPERGLVPYRPGEKVFTISEIRGFAIDNQSRISLGFEIVPLDPGGLAVTEPWTYAVNQRLDDPDEPVRLTFNLELPPFAPPGSYKLQVKVRDRLNDHHVEVVPGFSVSDSGMVPAETLEIRDFEISHRKNGQAEADPVFQAGQRVYMTCRLMGLQLLNGRADASFELQVLDPSGVPLLEKPSVVQIADLIPYHPPTHFVTLNFWVGLANPTPGGSYVINYKVTDRVAGRVLEKMAGFQVE
jgi:uncharacterized RDD family membrane protein YckC